MPGPPFIKTGGFSVGGVRVDGTQGQIAPFDREGVDFSRQKFDALLEAKGWDVVWERAAVCPNRPKDGVAPRAHDVNCSFCDGYGYVYFDACPTKMLIQGVTYDEQFTSKGWWGASRVTVTARPGSHLSWWDRISLQAGIARFTQLLRRQPVGNDYPKYKPICIEYVAWKDRSGSLQRLDEKSVFINADGTLAWPGTVKPDGNVDYSISYTYRPRFVVQDLLHWLRDSTVVGKQVDFPVTAVAKADFLVRDESRDPPMEQDADSPFKFR